MLNLFINQENATSRDTTPQSSDPLIYQAGVGQGRISTPVLGSRHEGSVTMSGNEHEHIPEVQQV